MTEVEELAGVDIFCSDKTGTLTKNEMQVADPMVFDGFSEEELLLYAVLASQFDNHDPIEIPLFHWLDNNYPESNWQQWQQDNFFPFDPIQKYTSAQVTYQERTLHTYKGAPQVILALARTSDNELIAIEKSIDLFASKGYRTLAVAIKEGDGDITLVGLIPLIDPEREDSAQVIQSMKNHGVQVKMITGDNIAIAQEIGRRLGLNERTIRSKDLEGKGSNQLLAFSKALSSSIYQRLYPDVSQDAAQKFSEEVMQSLEQSYELDLLQQDFIHTHESTLIDTLESVDIFAEVPTKPE
ncbi:MAG: HAD family hydrolase, partial [Candidatus Electrothrix sp. ATG1]|nr:HAD family hydrolase [Candidatus Electrothrix sp. ATG1]